MKTTTTYEIKNISKTNFGVTASISGNGLVIAIGHGTYKNIIDIYKFINGSWNYTESIAGYTTTHNIMSVVFNYDGSILIRNLRSSSSTNQYSHVYKFQNDKYELLFNYNKLIVGINENNDNLFIVHYSSNGIVPFKFENSTFSRNYIEVIKENGYSEPEAGMGNYANSSTHGYSFHYNDNAQFKFNNNIYFVVAPNPGTCGIHYYNKIHNYYELIYRYDYAKDNLLEPPDQQDNPSYNIGRPTCSDITDDGKIWLIGHFHNNTGRIVILAYDNTIREYKIIKTIIGDTNSDLGAYNYLKIESYKNNKLIFNTSDTNGFKTYEIDLNELFSFEEYQL